MQPKVVTLFPGSQPWITLDALAEKRIWAARGAVPGLGKRKPINARTGGNADPSKPATWFTRAHHKGLGREDVPL